MDGEWTDPPYEIYHSPLKAQPRLPWNQKYFDLPQKPKIPSLSLTLAEDAHYTNLNSYMYVYGNYVTRSEKNNNFTILQAWLVNTLCVSISKNECEIKLKV